MRGRGSGYWRGGSPQQQPYAGEAQYTSLGDLSRTHGKFPSRDRLFGQKSRGAYNSPRGGGYHGYQNQQRGGYDYQNSQRGGYRNHSRGGGGGGGRGRYQKMRPALQPAQELQMGDVRLNAADRIESFMIAGNLGFRKDGETRWAGCRATHAIDCAQGGKWAYMIEVQTAGSIRIGWSTADSKYEIGTDHLSFGYGGTGTKSHKRKYIKWGQSWGKDDVMTALLDCDSHVMRYAKNGNTMPGDCFKIPQDFWHRELFPSFLVKDGTFRVTFEGGFFDPARQCERELPPGYRWVSSPGKPWRLRSDKKSKKPNTAGLDVNQALRHIHTRGLVDERYQAGGSMNKDWKKDVNTYTAHFRALLKHEYEAEREQVKNRTARNPRSLASAGMAAFRLLAEISKDTDQREQHMVTLRAATGRLPMLTEIKIGREVLISGDRVVQEDAKYSIQGRVARFGQGNIYVETRHNVLPHPGREGYRLDLGANVTTFERMDVMLDKVQRCEGLKCEHTGKALRNTMGLLQTQTKIADALYGDIEESSVSALKWDPLIRPKPNPDSDVSKAARVAAKPTPNYAVQSTVPERLNLNHSQQEAVRIVVEERRTLTFIQGPPGTGKTTTAAAIVCGWLGRGCGPILATAFSNKGTDHLGWAIHNHGVKVVRIGHAAEVPFTLDEWQKRVGSFDNVMKSVDVVCVTCVGAGMGLLKKYEFPYVVMDEAAQVIEPAALIPLSKASVSCVMVGDQCQLPPTVLSNDATMRGLGVSLFDRLINFGMDVHLLDTQYRMHPDISSFSSWRFYRNELQDGVEHWERPVPVPWLATNVAFIHVDYPEESRGASKKNIGEAYCAAALVEWLSLAKVETGVITPYAAQVMEIRRIIRSRQMYCSKDVSVNSVDAFQGSEREAILVSMVRSNSRGSLGFVSDWRRLNVAITRAKKLVIIICHLPTLCATESITRDVVGFHRNGTATYLAWDCRTSQPHPLPENLKQRYVTNNIVDRPKPLPKPWDYIPVYAEDAMDADSIPTVAGSVSLAAITGGKPLQPPQPVKIKQGRVSRESKPRKPEGSPPGRRVQLSESNYSQHTSTNYSTARTSVSPKPKVMSFSLQKAEKVRYQPQAHVEAYKPPARAASYQPQGRAVPYQPQERAVPYQPQAQAEPYQPQTQAKVYHPQAEVISYNQADLKNASYDQPQAQAVSYQHHPPKKNVTRRGPLIKYRPMRQDECEEVEEFQAYLREHGVEVSCDDIEEIYYEHEYDVGKTMKALQRKYSRSTLS